MQPLTHRADPMSLSRMLMWTVLLAAAIILWLNLPAILSLFR